ncbi:MAG: 4a-hydroxytetrahydrobiopterin dehydratase [Pseudomonadales bacterium]|nr:4a-hydroxytetrahydrobiopterin dehydratase [Pseudomonadales bacterium]
MKVSELVFDKKHPVKETLSQQACRELADQLPDWSVTEADGIPQLVAEFSFKDFAEALAFTNAIGELAEKYNHHPAITTEYGRVTVRWWTHTAGGIANNDFVLARETSRAV